MAKIQFKLLPESPERTTIVQLTFCYNSKRKYFIYKLSEAIARVTAAFYPHEVIVGMNDFRTNEYASLIGGRLYEPKEENLMIGFRGAPGIGLSGQTPSDFPEFSQFLVMQGIDSISFTPEALVKGIENIAKAENKLLHEN